jgi:NADPH-dependent ferric siderophore reductase
VTTPKDSSVQLAERTGAHARVATLVAREQLSASLVQVTLEADVDALAGHAGQDVMVLVNTETTMRRRYSVRRVNRDAGTLDLWIQTTHDGPGATWARDAELGSTLDVVGPRGKIFLDPVADWHLFVGAVSALGAFYSLAESIEPPGRALFVVEIDDPSDALTTPFDEGLAVTGVFVDRAGREQRDPAGLLAALATLELPADEGHAYVFSEFHVTRTIRAALTERGLSDSALSHKAYFRAGLANRDGGEPLKD